MLSRGERLTVVFRSFALIACILLLRPPQASGADGKPVWVEAKGEAVLGDYDTQKEVVERARTEAKKNAVDKAVGTFLKSHTLVMNNQIAEDFVYARVRGSIEQSSILEEGWDKNDRSLYRVRLKALVKPLLPDASEGIQVKLSLSKTDLQEGEEVKIFYEPNTDCSIYIFSVAADGSVTLLLPNSLQKDNHVLRDKGYTFPPEGSPVRLQAMFLPGSTEKQAVERVKIIATRKDEALIPLGFQEGMFTVYDARGTGLVNDLARKLNQLDPADWGEASASYTIRR